MCQSDAHSALRHDLPDRLSAFDTNKRVVETTKEIRQLRGIEPQLMQYCGVHVLDVKHVVNRAACTQLLGPLSSTAADFDLGLLLQRRDSAVQVRAAARNLPSEQVALVHTARTCD